MHCLVTTTPGARAHNDHQPDTRGTPWVLAPKKQQPGFRNTPWDPSGCSHPKPCSIPAVTHPRRHHARFSLQWRVGGSESRSPWRPPLIPRRGQHFGLVPAQPGSLPRLGARDRKLPAASQSRPAGKAAAHGDTSWGRGGHGARVGGCYPPSAPRSDAAPGAASPRRCPTAPTRVPARGNLRPRSRRRGAPAGPGAPSRAPHAQNTLPREGKALPVSGRTAGRPEGGLGQG